MRKALSIFTMLVFLTATVVAAPSKPKSKSFPILNSLIDCLLSKTKKSPSKKNTSSSVSGIVKTGAGTLVINGNSGTYSSGATVNVGNSAGALTTSSLVMGGSFAFEINDIQPGDIGAGGDRVQIASGSSILNLQLNLYVPGKTVIAGQDVEFVLNSLLLLGSTTYQWQRSTDQGATWTNLVDGADISGSQTSKVTVHQVDTSMNGHLFKCLVYSNGTLINPTGSPGLLTVL